MINSNVLNTQIDGRKMSAGHWQGRINSMVNQGSTGIFPPIPTLSPATNTTSTVTTTMSSRVFDSRVGQRSSQGENELLRPGTQAGGAVYYENEYSEPAIDQRPEGINIFPDMQKIFDLIDQRTEADFQWNTEQRAVNAETSAAINRLSQILGEMVHSQRDLLNRLDSRDNSTGSHSPVDWNATNFQVRRSTVVPRGQGLAGGEGTVAPPVSRNQPENSRDRTDFDQTIPLSVRFNYLQEQLQQLQLSQSQQQAGARGEFTLHNQDNFERRSGHDSQSQNTRLGMTPPPSQSPYQNLNRGTRYFMDEKRRKDILSSLKLGNLIFPQDGMSVEEFLQAVESRAHREGWTEDEALDSMGYMLRGTPARWFDNNYQRWGSYIQFKMEFRKAFGTVTPDYQISSPTLVNCG
ncbi:uncharacterized protein LOC141538419 [Cotesia typhae]|uniref:uncharacterized protein LOC141538419 n=1 Tax=Cotesia typhae TaxID=2053667 RepID=UPI003D684B00